MRRRGRRREGKAGAKSTGANTALVHGADRTVDDEVAVVGSGAVVARVLGAGAHLPARRAVLRRLPHSENSPAKE